MMWGNYDGGWWIVMWLSMTVFWGLVIIGAIMLMNPFGRNTSQTRSPEEMLEYRLAAGEIDEEQYRALRDELQGRPHGPRAPVH